MPEHDHPRVIHHIELFELSLGDPHGLGYVTHIDGEPVEHRHQLAHLAAGDILDDVSAEHHDARQCDIVPPTADDDVDEHRECTADEPRLLHLVHAALFGRPYVAKPA